MRSSLNQFTASAPGSGRGDADAAHVGHYSLDDRSPAVINDPDTFWTTLRRYAELHRVDAGHLADTLRMTMHPGEPVTAERIWQAAGALARGGYTREPNVA